MTISVSVVEDDPEFLGKLKRAVDLAGDMRLQGFADDLPGGLRLLEREAADIFLVDLGLPSGSGLSLIEKVKYVWPKCDVLVLTVFGDHGNVMSAIKAGATGYLLKDSSIDILVEQIRTVHSGGSVISPSIARQLFTLFAGNQAQPIQSELSTAGQMECSLTAQERQVLSLAYKGYKYDEVARIMGISRHTVLTYVKRCYRKLHVNSKTEALYEAKRLGVELD